jgi:CHAT domain-containing protein
LSTESLNLANFRERFVDTSTALVVFFQGPQKTFAFVISNTAIKGVELEHLPTTQLRSQVHRWLEILGRVRARGPAADVGNTEMFQMLEAWHATLFEFLRAFIQPHVQRLVFVPHLLFHLIPMHALCQRRSGVSRFLIDDFDEISYAPSISVLIRCMERPSGKLSTLVAAQNPTGDLPQSEAEVEAIAKLFEVTTRMGTQTETPATADTFIQNARFADVVLFSGHSIGGDLETAALLLNDGRLRAADLLAKLYLNNCSLWDFDSCESAIPAYRESDEWITLASVPLCAGAATVWSTLWTVDDAAAAELKQMAYRNVMKGGLNKVRGLNDAQREFLHRSDGRKDRLPFYWAPFIVVGAR